jgi:bacillithiol biosynthesis cysteine-adding enzyme BshC
VADQPVGEAVLPAPPIDKLHEALRDLPFAAQVVEMTAAAYQPGRSMGEAFSAMLRGLLAHFDLIHLDPMEPAVRRLAAPALRHAVEAAPELASALLERNRALVEAGYHAQVHVEDETSLVFLLENGRRLALRRHGDTYVQNGRRFSAAELAARAEALSPNALLRPVVQDSMLPTAAYVGGPAELAYLAQSEVIYRRLLGRMPVAVPRSGFTILDAHSRKLLDRYGLSLPDFYQGESALRQRMAATLVPPELAATVAQTRTVVEAAMDHLRASLEAFDPTLAAATARSRAKMTYQTDKTARKIGREMMARDARASSDAARLFGLIYPERHLQERLYSIIPMIARHGTDLPERLYEAVRLDCPDHQVVTL